MRNIQHPVLALEDGRKWKCTHKERTHTCSGLLQQRESLCTMQMPSSRSLQLQYFMEYSFPENDVDGDEEAKGERHACSFPPSIASRTEVRIVGLRLVWFRVEPRCQAQRPTPINIFEVCAALV